MRRRYFALCLLGVALAAAAVPARANQDAVQFFDNIHVTPDNPVHDAVCFFCSVNADGDVKGDIVVFFGGIHINGHANHDVVNFFGDVTAADNSVIGGDLVSFFGSVHLGENVSVARDMVAIFGSVHAANSASIGRDHVVFSPWISFGLPPVLVLVIIFVIAYEVRSRRHRQFMMNYPMPPRP